MAAGVGAVTGFAIACFEWITAEVLLSRVETFPTWVRAWLPMAGLMIAAIALRWVARETDPSTSDEYIKYFHETGGRLPLSPVIGRVIAGVATLGTGGAMGFEGPSIYIGAAIGSFAQRRLRLEITRDQIKTLLVAGAAAGVAAIFKAPATGALFAIEVPYQEDLVATSVVPAIIAAATSYVTFVAIKGTTPLFPAGGEPLFNISDLLGAAGVGVACGLGSRLFAWVIQVAKNTSNRLPRSWSWLVGGVGLALLAFGSTKIFGAPLSLGPGYGTISWLGDPSRALGLVALLFGVRLLATAFTVAGGGAGGLFIPLVVQGALLGRLVEGVIGVASPLFPLVGAAAFLGAGYATPITGVVFVAESTGRPGFVVPGLIATAIAQLLRGDASVSRYQQRSRGGHVERRLRLKVRDSIAPEAIVVDPATTLEELLHQDLLKARARSLPVVAEGRYLGMVRLADVEQVPREDRSRTLVEEILVAEIPAANPEWSLRDAAGVMDEWRVERLAVAGDGGFVGVVTLDDILRVRDVLEAE
ncbi:MAG: chloride channel protein family [Actinomycetota bacterium]|nr:chloride channel protein family [Actinomycetota bacterium]